MRESLTLVALVKDGSPDLSADQVERWAAFFRAREGKQVSLTASVNGKPRSNPQNRLYWGWVLNKCIELCEDWSGQDADTLHDVFKEMFIPMQYQTIKGKVYPVGKSTTRLTTDEFSAYIEKIRAYMATEHGVMIPPHDEIPLPQ